MRQGFVGFFGAVFMGCVAVAQNAPLPAANAQLNPQNAQPVSMPVFQPDISVITQRNFSFINMAKTIELAPAPSLGPNVYWIIANIFTNGSTFLAGNSAAVVNSKIAVKVTGSPGNWILTDMHDKPIVDIVHFHKHGGASLVFTPKSPIFLKALVKRHFSFLQSSCTEVHFTHNKAMPHNIYKLKSPCAMAYKPQFGIK